ncbi:Pkinase domain containing protein, partial [Asbolus verrucosus]
LYIHESYGLQTKEYVGTAIAETSSVAKIPWKPVSASGFLTEDDSTAISHVLKLLELKEILVILLTTSFLFNIIFKSFARHHQKREIIFVERTVKEPSESGSESSNTFSSRFLNDFHTLRCLGKGGFGVVFEVKQKIDECHYAIKRIVLPNEENKREAVMREVKALAKLEHHNIVRYFNSWVENPPHGWQQEHDGKWIKETSEFPTESTTGLHMTSYNQGTDNIASSSQFMISKDLCNYKKEMTESNDSFVVFNESCSNTNDQHNSKKIDEKSGKTDTISCDNSQSLGGVNWRRPSRRYHSLCDTSVSKNSPVFLYIQMQLCQRQSLKEWLLENKDRQFTYILGIFKQIVSAVEYVHMQGLIHRDLK